MVNVARCEHELLAYATESLQRIPGLRLIDTANEKAGVLSFVLDGLRTEDVGHHCAQPILCQDGVRPLPYGYGATKG